ncbi:hypothetical protein [Zobellella maritima]|uniref:hypothetical protein n=1 Tax=Zobellella maritima TaxID=2059725 RepID=UPI000E309043|nr:hypothetical protein [Zobellella maritima]
MSWDHDRAAENKSELMSNLIKDIELKGTNSSDAQVVAQIIMDEAIRVSPPKIEEFVIELITMSPSGRRGGKSTKAGNIVLNMRSLVDAVTNGAFAVVSSYQIPWLAPFALILLWNSLWRSAKVEFSENDAALIWTMWVHRDRSNNEIAEEGLLNKLNEHLKKYSRSPVTDKDLKDSLNALEEIKSIKRSRRNPNDWWLCEWVKPTYH